MVQERQANAWLSLCRFEKEFDRVKDVFDLQVRFALHSSRDEQENGDGHLRKALHCFLEGHLRGPRQPPTPLPLADR